MQVATASFEEKIAGRELTNLSHSWHVEMIFEFVTLAPIFNDRDIHPSTLAQHQLCIKTTDIHPGHKLPASLHAFSPKYSTPLYTLCNPRPYSTSELYPCKSTNVIFWYVLFKFAVGGSSGIDNEMLLYSTERPRYICLRLLLGHRTHLSEEIPAR